jgi:hypothetical protein
LAKGIGLKITKSGLFSAFIIKTHPLHGCTESRMSITVVYRSYIQLQASPNRKGKQTQ